MDILIDDVIIYITFYLCYDMYRISFLSSSKYFHKLKDKIYYNDIIKFNIWPMSDKKLSKLSKMRHLWYFDRFTNVKTDDLDYQFPKSITHLTLGYNFDFNSYKSKNINIKNYIPSSVT